MTRNPDELIYIDEPNPLVATREEFAVKVEQARGFYENSPVIETRTGKDLRGVVGPRLIGFPGWIVPVIFDKDPGGEQGTIRAVDPADLIVDPEPRKRSGE